VEKKHWWRTKTKRAASFDLWERLLPFCQGKLSFRLRQTSARQVGFALIREICVVALRLGVFALN